MDVLNFRKTKCSTFRVDLNSFATRFGYMSNNFHSTLFQIFYWTHQLCFVWWLILALHGKDFWKWCLIPFVLYLIERVMKLSCFVEVRHGLTHFESYELLPSKVCVSDLKIKTNRQLRRRWRTRGGLSFM